MFNGKRDASALGLTQLKPSNSTVKAYGDQAIVVKRWLPDVFEVES